MLSDRVSPWRAVTLALLSLLLISPAVHALGASASQREGLLASPRSDHAATLLGDGSVLITGGFDGQSQPASVEIIDPVAATIVQLGSLSSARSGHSATLLPDGRILLAGGRADGASVDSAELFDPTTGSSEPTGSMRWARADHTALELPDGRVLLTGGVDGSDPVARSEHFDPATGTFSKTSKSKAAHTGAAASLLPDGRVLLTGDVRKRKAKAAERYDPVKGKWVALKGAAKRAGHTSTRLVDGRVLLAGGSKGDSEVGGAEIFDPARGSFATAGKMVVPRVHHTTTLLFDGRVLVSGGVAAGTELADIELFDPASGDFSEAGALPLPRVGHTATRLPDGRVLVVGGTVAGLVLDDVVLYDPVTESLTSLDGTPIRLRTDALDEEPEARMRADIRARHGPPDAFTIFYSDEVATDGTAGPARLEQWTYYGNGMEYTFADGQLVAEDSVELEPGAIVEPAPYDPDQFSADLSLDEVVAAAGVEEYLGGPVDDLVEGGELYVADRLMWGIKDGELRYVEALALDAGAADA